MNNFPLVTIFIYAYGKPDYLYQAIDSALRQDYQNIELIVSDDCSDDFDKQSVIEYIQNHKKSNVVKYLVDSNEQNLRTVKHINKMIPKFSGEYIIPLAGDDVFYDNSVVSRIVVRFLETDALVMCCGRTEADEKTLVTVSKRPNIYEKFFIKKLNSAEKQFEYFSAAKFLAYSGCVTCYARKLVDLIGLYDETYSIWEDGPRFYQIVSNGIYIENAFDIIEIKHRLGGSSTCDKKSMYSIAINKEYDIYKQDIIIPFFKKTGKVLSYYEYGVVYPLELVKGKIKLALKYPVWWIAMIRRNIINKRERKEVVND